jgi:hypothetical protein
MLRLRAGFGVGVKADLLAFLIGVAGDPNAATSPATVERIAKAIACSVASTRRAATEMVLAGLIEVNAERPANYSVDAAPWASLLHLQSSRKATPDTGDGTPPWRSWAQVFALLAACATLADDARFLRAATVVQASHLRDLAERHRRALSWNGIPLPDPRLFLGERYREAFGLMLDAVVEWVRAKA